jgi:alpha,alpha-trehalose phosphorylase
VENVKYTLREGVSLTIRHETEEIQLTRENPASVRPISSS